LDYLLLDMLIIAPIQAHTLWAIKNMALYFCPYLQQLLTDLKKIFTGTLSKQFAIM